MGDSKAFIETEEFSKTSTWNIRLFWWKKVLYAPDMDSLWFLCGKVKSQIPVQEAI